MFCPKCGTQNPDNGKFCRSCGTDLGSVAAALSGNLPENTIYPGTAYVHQESRRRQDPNEVYADGIKGIITGIGFLIISAVLLNTNVAGGQSWWWALLFPGFIGLAKGISDCVKSKRMEKRMGFSGSFGGVMNQPNNPAALSSSQTDFDEIQELINLGRKIEAIKVHREMFGTSLKDAKEAVENIEREQSAPKDYVEPSRPSAYDTGDLQPPPSITEYTTRHLETDSEGETMTLPKK